jgi:hypothetical protein
MVVPFVGSHWRGPVMARFQEVFGAVLPPDGWKCEEIDGKCGKSPSGGE